MKNILRISALALALTVLLTSCERTVVVEDPSLQKFETVLINVNGRDWQYSNIENNNYYMATVNMPEITGPVFKEGLVKMYRVYNWGTNNASQVEMPFTRHNEECIDPIAGEWVFYTETVDYEFSPGIMSIFYTVSDFDYELNPSFVPENMTFRCVIMY